MGGRVETESSLGREIGGGGGVNSLFCFVFLSRKTLSTFKIWEKSFRESVMLAESHPEIPPSLLQPPLAFRPRAPSSSPHSPLRIAPGPTATPALQPGSQASPHRNGPFAQLDHHDYAAPTPALRILCCPAFTPGIRRALQQLVLGAAYATSASRRAQGTGADLGAEQPLHWRMPT